MAASDPIEQLPNLGPKSSRWLRDSGILTIGDLENIGPVAAFMIVRNQGIPVSLNLLYEMSAGLERRDWRELCDGEKADLRRQLNALEAH